MLKRSSNQAALITPAQEPVLFLSCFKETNALSPIWETQELSSTESLPKKNWLSSFHMIISLFDLTNEKEFKSQEEKYTDSLMRDSKSALPECGLMKKDQVSLSHALLEIFRQKRSVSSLSLKFKTSSLKRQIGLLSLALMAAGM
jgi:hypothetical protein